jgi:hypothetical protein
MLIIRLEKTAKNVKNMKKISLYILFLIFYSCNNVNKELMKPLDELNFGMRKEKALSKIAFYKSENIINKSDIINIDDEQAEISFLYCRDCFGLTLEGVTLRSSNTEKLYQKLKIQLNNKNYILKKHIILDSYDMFLTPPFDTLICIYTTKMMYEEIFGTLRCKKLLSDPCW